MKPTWRLLLGILCSAALLFAADQNKNKETKTKHGTICDAQCVTKVNDRNTCNPTCTEKSGEAVFVDDDGSIMKIENQSMAKPGMGKHVNIKCTEAQREDTLRIQQLNEAP
jgi:hypothetical protein